VEDKLLTVRTFDRAKSFRHERTSVTNPSRRSFRGDFKVIHETPSRH
jgi:hypothetical protein